MHFSVLFLSGWVKHETIYGHCKIVQVELLVLWDHPYEGFKNLPKEGQEMVWEFWASCKEDDSHDRRYILVKCKREYSTCRIIFMNIVLRTMQDQKVSE